MLVFARARRLPNRNLRMPLFPRLRLPGSPEGDVSHSPEGMARWLHHLVRLSQIPSKAEKIRPKVSWGQHPILLRSSRAREARLPDP
jgi:hypothetical protein